MHSKNIRANLATASLVVIAACIAGPQVIRAGKFLWDYPVRQNKLYRQQVCLHFNTFLVEKDSPFYEKSSFRYPIWSTDSYRYEKCLESWNIPDNLVRKQLGYFTERPAFPDTANWLEDFMWSIRDPLDNIYWWYKKNF